MTILHRMISLYNSLDGDSIYRQVLTIMIQNLSLLPSLTLEEVAELCNSSTITITRLMKKLECSSFPVYKEQLRETLDTYVKHNRSFPVAAYDEKAPMKSYIEFVDTIMLDMLTRINDAQLQTACSMISASETVHLYDLYPLSQAKKMLQVDLAYQGKLSSVPLSSEDVNKDAESLGEGSLLIITLISSLPNYAQHLRIVREAHEKGVPMIILTSTTTPACGDLSDCILSFRGTDSASDNLFIDLLLNMIGLVYRKLYIDSAAV